MEAKKKRAYNRKIANKAIEEELGKYNEQKESLKESKSVFENYHYLSTKEKSNIDNKFAKPKNKSQYKYVQALNNINHKIIIANGPAGTGKTLFATEYGLKNFLMGKYEKIIFTRPAVTTDEDLGYLPGTLEEKMAPWIRPIYDILYRFISPSEVYAMIEEKIIEISPLAFMRGRTFKNTWIIADEIQNSTRSQMKMLLTRLGENSRMVITGDLDQHDRKDEINGLQDFLEKFRGCRSDSISNIEFENDDIEREQVVKEILNIYGGMVPELYIRGSPTNSVSDIVTPVDCQSDTSSKDEG
jgi:phosphate starvation-inducible PhoH-like protein